jgi:UDP-glucose 4-epimerase
MFSAKTLLLTGGTGSFSNVVLRRFLTIDIDQIRAARPLPQPTAVEH